MTNRTDAPRDRRAPISVTATAVTPHQSVVTPSRRAVNASPRSRSRVALTKRSPRFQFFAALALDSRMAPSHETAVCFLPWTSARTAHVVASIALGVVLLGGCAELKDNEPGPSNGHSSDAANTLDRSYSDNDESDARGDSSSEVADASSPGSPDSDDDGAIRDRDVSWEASSDAAEERPDGGVEDADIGEPTEDVGPSNDADAAPPDAVSADGDSSTDGDDAGADGLVDSNDGPICIADCAELGQFRCADGGDAGISRQVQVCSLVRGCLQWFQTAVCRSNEACCDGACTPLTCEQGTCPPSPTGTTGSCGATFDVYVDASAPTTGKCTLESPCRTVTAGIAAALVNPVGRRRILVAAGKYDVGLGERFPLNLRGGVTLVGSGNNTVIEGSGLVAHDLSGGDVISDFYATIMMGDFDPMLSNNISNVQVRPDPLASVTLLLGIVCDRGNAQEDQIPSRPGATISRVVLGPAFNFAVLVTNSTIPSASGCYLRMTGSTVHESRGGVWLTGCSIVGSPLPAVGAQIGGLSPGSGNEFRNIRSGLNGFPIRANACTRRLLIESNSFVGSDSGIFLDRLGFATLTSSATIVANRFEALDNFGMNVQGSISIDEFRQNSFHNVSSALNPGVWWATPALVFEGDHRMTVKARNNLFTGNDIGVLIRNTDPAAPVSGNLDFGTTADPGKNTFRCNSGPGDAGLVGGDIVFDEQNIAGPTVAFDGNYWDQAPPTTNLGTTPPRNGLDITLLNSHPPLNVQGSLPSDRVCAAGRVP